MVRSSHASCPGLARSPHWEHRFRSRAPDHEPGIGGQSRAHAPLAEFVAAIPVGTDLASAAAGVAVDGRSTLYVLDAPNDVIWIFGQGDLRGELGSTRRQGPVVATSGETGDGPGQFAFQFPWGPPHWAI